MQHELINECKNCSGKLTGNFCSTCGQKKLIKRLNFQDIISDFLSSVFNLDGPFLKTLLGLFYRPGSLVKSFISGQRTSFYAPIRYLLVCFFITFIIGKLIGFDVMELQGSSVDTNNLGEKAKHGMLVGKFMAKYLNFFIFIFPFCIALATKMWFWNKTYNLAERTVLGFFLSGQFILISVVPMLLSFIDSKLFYLQHLLSILYLTISFSGFFYVKSKIKTRIKSFLAAIFSMILYFAVAYFVASMILKNFNITP